MHLMGIEGGGGNERVEIEDLFIPNFERQVRLIEGEDEAAKGAGLAQPLMEIEVL